MGTSSKGKKKWALVSWNHLTKPHMEGGLGLKDPYILKQLMGENFLWIWIEGGNDLWKMMWERKHNIPQSIEEKLRI